MSAQENAWLGKLTVLNMTLMGWLGRKTSTQTTTKRQQWQGNSFINSNKHWSALYVACVLFKESNKQQSYQ